MNAALVVLGGLVLYVLAYRIYGRYISEKLFEQNDANPTPAVAMKDDIDYVPTKPLVLFGHHFASIAGGGPIIGPTVAMLFGYVPVWLWLVFGAIFIGAVHDLAALFTSVREKGKSMAEVAEKTLGRAGFMMFVAFTIVSLLLVTSAFLGLTATALTSMVPLDKLGLDSGQTLLRTVTGADGVAKAQIGGVASTSVIVITSFAPLLGFLIYRRQINVYLAALLAVALCVFSVFIGLSFPITFKPTTWMVILCLYTFLAAGIPVWLILQPRDFTNSFLLYAGVASLIIGGILAGINGLKMDFPAWNVAQGSAKLGSIWPFLFITVACGAISGFHSLVAGGTTSKQLGRESDARKIAYGGMLLEGLLAIGVLVAIGCGIAFSSYTSIVFPTDPSVKSNPILAFAMGVGGLLDKTMGIPAAFGCVFGILLVEGFVATTLDTAVRLNRYMFEELWSFIFGKNVPQALKSYLFNAGLCVVLMFALGYTNAFLVIWPIFGSANQLLASLALIAISVWLMNRNKRIIFTIVPAIFMMATTLYSLVLLLFTKYLPKNNYALAVMDILLIALAVGVIVLAIKKMTNMGKAVTA